MPPIVKKPRKKKVSRFLSMEPDNEVLLYVQDLLIQKVAPYRIAKLLKENKNYSIGYHAVSSYLKKVFNLDLELQAKAKERLASGKVTIPYYTEEAQIIAKRTRNMINDGIYRTLANKPLSYQLEFILGNLYESLNEARKLGKDISKLTQSIAEIHKLKMEYLNSEEMVKERDNIRDIFDRGLSEAIQVLNDGDAEKFVKILSKHINTLPSLPDNQKMIVGEEGGKKDDPPKN